MNKANPFICSTVFCDYCDVYLTHDSMSVRKAHNSGRNHLRNVVDYYQQIGHEKAQSVIDSITSSYAAEGQAHANPMLPQNQPGAHGAGGAPGAFPPPFGFPGGMPPPFPGMPGAPPMLPPGAGFPAGMPRKYNLLHIYSLGEKFTDESGIFSTARPSRTRSWWPSSLPWSRWYAHAATRWFALPTTRWSSVPTSRCRRCTTIPLPRHATARCTRLPRWSPAARCSWFPSPSWRSPRPPWALGLFRGEYRIRTIYQCAAAKNRFICVAALSSPFWVVLQAPLFTNVTTTAAL